MLPKSVVRARFCWAESRPVDWPPVDAASRLQHAARAISACACGDRPIRKAGGGPGLMRDERVKKTRAERAGVR
jgi:hypothetical protein